MSIIDLQVGQGDTDTLLSRIQSDLVPIYSAAEGFVAYYAIKKTDDSVTTIRIFQDKASLDAARQNADAATKQIVNDLQLETDDTPHIHAEAAIHAP